MKTQKVTEKYGLGSEKMEILVQRQEKHLKIMLSPLEAKGNVG